MKKKAGIILVVLLVCLLSTVIVACENTIYYTVTFETNGGSQVEEVSVNPGDSIASPTSTKEGYVLEGWYDNADFNGEKITFPYTPDKDTKLFAKWSIESYVGTYVGLVSYVDEEYAHYIGLVPHVYEIFIMTLNEDGTGKFVGASSDFEGGFSDYSGREFDAKYAIDGGKISIEVTKSLDFRPEVFYLNGSVKNGAITLSELSSFSDDNFTNVVFNRINSDNQSVLGTYSDIVPEGMLEEGIVKLHVALDTDSNFKYSFESTTGEIGSDEDDTDMQYLIVGDTILLLRDSGDRISITRGQFVDGAITMYGGLWQFVFTRNLSGGTVCETGKHEFGRWIVSQSAFCVSEGVERRACKVCGIKESKTIPPTGVHSSYYRSDDEEHRYVCFHCDYVDVEKSGKHNYGNEIVEQEPTCGYMGRGYRECGVCEHRIYFDIPATGEHTCIDEYNDYRHWQYCSVCHNSINGASHEFLEKNDSTGHWKECSGCEYVSETIPHTLDYAYDANEHWSKCEDCDYVVDKTAHTMTEKSDVNNHWTECTECNYKSAKIVHTYENRYDKDNHWEECSGCSYVNNKKAHVLTLTNSETEHWHQCSECSYKSEIETHAFEEAYDKSNHWQQCSVCAYVKDKTAHTTLSIRHDDTYHWRGCDDCEYTEDQQAYNKHATWGKNDEEHWQHCSVCSQEINRSTHGNFRITHERERGLHNELCGTCGINAGLQVDCFSNEWKASDKSHFNTCDYCNEFVKLEHEFDIFVAIGINKCGCGEFKCNENLQYKLINDNTEYSVSYDKTAETELITLILPDYYEDPVTGEILPVTRIEDNGFTGLEISEFFISPSINFIQGYAFSGSKINALFIEDMNAWCNMSYSSYGNSLLSIVDDLYYDMKYANDLVLPDGITNINSYAFEGFKGLKSITIPDSVITIGSYAFSGCSGLTSITIPESVTKIGSSAFSRCSKLFNIIIPDSVIDLGSYAFANCINLSRVTIGKGVEYIGNYVFKDSRSVVLYAKVDTRPAGWEQGWNILQYGEVIPVVWDCNNNDVAEDGNTYFMDENGICYFHKDGAVTVWRQKNTHVNVNIPDYITYGQHEYPVSSIMSGAFAGCSLLESLNIPFVGKSISGGGKDGVLGYIFGTDYFDGSYSVKQIHTPGATNSTAVFYIPMALREVIVRKGYIRAGAFQNCTYLKSIEFGKDIVSIDSRAFINCYGVEIISVDKNNTTYSLIDNCLISRGYYLVRAFKNCTIPDSVTIIGEYAFAGQEWLIEIAIPDGVTTIGRGAFEGCNGLTSITIPDGVTTIGDRAFYECNGLTSITIPDGVTTIGDRAFYECSGLTSITIPDGVTTIGSNAFYYCRGLTSITIPDSVTSIGESAFYGCSGLTSITIPDSVTTIGSNAFYYCRGLTIFAQVSEKPSGWSSWWNDSCPVVWDCDNNDIADDEFIYIVQDGIRYGIKDGNAIVVRQSENISTATISATITYNGIAYSVKTIEESAFYYCSGLTSITIPDSVTTIGSSAFSGCRGLTSITIPDSVTSIGEHAFSYCSGLTSVIIGKGTTTIGNSAFSGCRGLTSITIPDSVTSIGEHAFSYCSGLTSVVIGKGTTTIGSSAFAYCSGLTSITISDSVISIGERAFSGCSGLTSVIIGDNVTTIGSYAFSYCSGLTSVIIGNSVTTIGVEAFSGCNGLESITLPFIGATKDGTDNTHFGYIFGADSYSENYTYVPASLKTVVITSANAICERAFYECSGLTSITIPESVTTIGNGAFDRCSGLTSITIPDSVTTIGSYAFDRCSGLTSVTIPESVTTIGDWAFDSCSGLTSVVIGKGVTTIGSGAFYSCSGLTSVVIGKGVTTIGNGAFWNCIGLTIYVQSSDKPNGWHHSWNYSNCPVVWDCDKNEVANDGYIYMTQDGLRYRIKDGSASVVRQFIGITKANIPSNVIYKGKVYSVNSISERAFNDCSELTSITIPNTVTNIDYYAFSNCSRLERIVVTDSNPKYHSNGNCLIETASKTLILGGTTSVIPSDGSVTTISDSAFRGCSGLTSITIPDSVTTIDDYAFSGCSGLTSIIIGNSVTTIGENAFSGCSGLTSITIPDGVTSIGEFAFYNCSGLESITLPFIGATKDGTGSTNLGYIFEGFSSFISTTLKTVVITSATAIGNDAFYNCSGLTSITIPDSVTTIGGSAFYGCSGLTSITIPDSVTTIGAYAFYNCSGLTSVIIGNSVTTIGVEAFSGCNGLESITLPFIGATKDGTDNTHFGYIFGADAYYKNYRYVPASLKTVVITSVNAICESAFYDCRELTSITIPESVTIIGESAFSGCSGLTSITIPDSVTTIGDWAFRNCSGLTSIIIPDSVTTICNEAFSGCSGLTSFTVVDSNPKYHSNGNCIIETESKTLVVGCKTSVIPANGSVTTIGDWAFRNCSGLTSIIIPDSVTTIGDRAFYYCSGLTSITIPESVTTIGSGAFSLCSGLTSITIPDSITTIGEWAFSECSGLTSVVIGKGVTTIGSYAFSLCSGLTSFTVADSNPKYHSNGNCIIETESKTLVVGCKTSVIPTDGSVTTISDSAFFSCSRLTSITIPDSVTTIGNRAFEGCSGLTSIIIGNGVTTIGSSAFSDCSGLTSITIPDGVTSIGDSAFRGCSGLTSIIYNGTMAEWQNISKESNWDFGTGNYTIICTADTLSK